MLVHDFGSKSFRLKLPPIQKLITVSQANTKRRIALVDPEVQGGVLKKIAVHWIGFACSSNPMLVGDRPSLIR
jgi:hypothetical protein